MLRSPPPINTPQGDILSLIYQFEHGFLLTSPIDSGLPEKQTYHPSLSCLPRLLLRLVNSPAYPQDASFAFELTTHPVLNASAGTCLISSHHITSIALET